MDFPIIASCDPIKLSNCSHFSNFKLKFLSRLLKGKSNDESKLKAKQKVKTRVILFTVRSKQEVIFDLFLFFGSSQTLTGIGVELADDAQKRYLFREPRGIITRLNEDCSVMDQ
jgi:hypothetical protein